MAMSATVKTMATRLRDFDTDRILKRRLYLQRYITHLGNEVAKANEPGDKALVLRLTEFVADADEKTLRALSQLRRSNKYAKALLNDIAVLVDEQSKQAVDLVNAEIVDLVEREAKVTTEAMGETVVPSMRGVATLPVGGVAIAAMIAGGYTRYGQRLIAEIVQAAGSAPETILRIVRGTRAERFKDGLYRWRDDRVIRPNVDLAVHGASNNAMGRVYEAFGVEKVNHLATADYRACYRCVAAEINGPYVLGRQPAIPVHVKCRCVDTPWVSADTDERPYVRDDRPVSKIPKDEREGKIGTTRESIEDFFARMSNEDLREYLGKSRYALWKAGKIDSIKDLVDSVTLKPLRLDQLPEL